VKPPPFDYVAASSVDEAAQALSEHGDDAKVLAGGQSLIPLLSLRLARPTVLVDLNRVSSLAGVTVDDAGGTTTLGAMTRHRTLERDATIARTVPLLAAAAPFIGHVAIRSRGTIGGSISHADPAAELPAIALALDATIVTTKREIPAADFFDGYFTTVLAPDEIVTAVRFPTATPGTRVSVKEMARRHGDFAMVAAAVQVTDGDARIALINVADRPVRATDAEAALRDGASIDDVAALATRDIEPVSDLHATSEYRRTVARTLVKRALAEVAA
jgi:carbon-monoxide dehydrogenase medium subunit